MPVNLGAPVVSACQLQCIVMATQTAGIIRMKKDASEHQSAKLSKVALRARSAWLRSGSVMENRTAKTAQMKRSSVHFVVLNIDYWFAAFDQILNELLL